MPSSIDAIQNETVTERDNITLTCTASGTPPPSVSWVKVSSGERVNGSELVFTNINRSEAGEYRCEASNECGNASESASIDVQCKFIMKYFKLVKYIIMYGHLGECTVVLRRTVCDDTD